MSTSETITRNDLENILNEVLPFAAADYIVEQGTDGIWTYRKWNSGIAECWGEDTGTTDSNGSYHFMTACPSFLISTSPIYITTSAWSSGYTETYIGYTLGSVANSVWYIDAWLKKGIPSGSCGATFSVKGRWK